MERLKLIILSIIIIFFVSCAKQQIPASEPPKQAEEPVKIITPQPECTQNSDCLPATCCHPDDCVPKGQEPNCYNAVCTDECKQVSMDCGQGKCECIDKKCTAVIYS